MFVANKFLMVGFLKAKHFSQFFKIFKILKILNFIKYFLYLLFSYDN
jgi:hypothetical protein